VLTHNPGAAWGLLGGIRPDSLRIFVFIIISVTAVGMVLWLAWKARADQKLLVWSAALVLGGALGNLIDRLVYGRVIDFLDVYTRAGFFSSLMTAVGKDPCHETYGCHWPAFNVADIAISIGVFLLATEGWWGKKPKAAA
jgi:signal peptidase II